MAPAVTAIAATPDGEARLICHDCMGDVADAALRCTHCKAHVHLRCSGLPVYQLIRLSVTQASYMCLACVKTKDLEGDEEKYSAEVSKIEEIIAKEVSIIEQTQTEANDNNENSDTNVNTQTSVDENKNLVSEADKIQKRPGICHFFMNKKCKHGPKGLGCKYEHPKICRYYAKLGENRGGGCKKGDKCKFAHPKLCWKATGGLKCDRKNCHFLHPYGFKYDTADEQTKSGKPTQTMNPKRNENRREASENPQKDQRRGQQSEMNPQNVSGDWVHKNYNRDAEIDFLEIRQQLDTQWQAMKQIQQQLTLLMRDRIIRDKTEMDPMGNFQRRM